jgi:hypothetical protein
VQGLSIVSFTRVDLARLLCIIRGAHDLALLIDVEGCGKGQIAWGIDGGQDTLVEQKTMVCSCGIEVLAHELAAVVNAEGRGERSVWNIDGGEDAFLVPQKAASCSSLATASAIATTAAAMAASPP